MKKYILKACNKLLEMDSAADIKKEGLTLSDYEIAWDAAVELSKTGKTETFVTAVADFFKRNGCTVVKEQINYHIS